jgi:hypothetical protein
MSIISRVWPDIPGEQACVYMTIVGSQGGTYERFSLIDESSLKAFTGNNLGILDFAVDDLSHGQKKIAHALEYFGWRKNKTQLTRLDIFLCAHGLPGSDCLWTSMNNPEKMHVDDIAHRITLIIQAIEECNPINNQQYGFKIPYIVINILACHAAALDPNSMDVDAKCFAQNLLTALTSHKTAINMLTTNDIRNKFIFVTGNTTASEHHGKGLRTAAPFHGKHYDPDHEVSLQNMRQAPYEPQAREFGTMIWVYSEGNIVGPITAKSEIMTLFNICKLDTQFVNNLFLTMDAVIYVDKDFGGLPIRKISPEEVPILTNIHHFCYIDSIWELYDVTCHLLRLLNGKYTGRYLTYEYKQYLDFHAVLRQLKLAVTKTKSIMHPGSFYRGWIFDGELCRDETMLCNWLPTLDNPYAPLQKTPSALKTTKKLEYNKKIDEVQEQILQKVEPWPLQTLIDFFIQEYLHNDPHSLHNLDPDDEISPPTLLLKKPHDIERMNLHKQQMGSYEPTQREKTASPRKKQKNRKTRH